MASFRCYDNSDVIAFLIMTNFHLYLIKLWWQFFQTFVYGDVVMLRIGRYWPWKTVTVSSHLHMPVRPLLLHRMVLVSFRLYVSEKFGQLARIFGQMLYRPPWQKFPVRLCRSSLLYSKPKGKYVRFGAQWSRIYRYCYWCIYLCGTAIIAASLPMLKARLS